MIITSILAVALISVFGFGAVVAAFHGEKLVAWENRKLGTLANAVRSARLSLEEERRLLHPVAPEAATQAEPQPVPAAKPKQQRAA